MGKDKCFVEFENVFPSQDQLDELENLVNEYIRQNHAVIINTEEQVSHTNKPDSLPDDIVEGVFRQVKIGTIPEKPCCGTHVRSTADIQCVKFLLSEKCRGGKNCKLWFVCGNRVFKLLQESLERDRELNKLLSTGPELFVERVAKIKQQSSASLKANKKLEKEIKQIEKKIKSFELGDQEIAKAADKQSVTIA